jgi:formylglycine-generating enzyme
VPLDDHFQWWSYVKGANWRHPEGPKSNLKGRGKYPVVQVAYEDALAYAKWADKRLPTEAEWEFAARGDFTGKLYPWGDSFQPSGKWMANTYPGHFPNTDSGDDHYVGIAPVEEFPPNGYGLYDMAGNVWEWTADYFTQRHPGETANACCVPRNPRVDGDAAPRPGERFPRKVIKGGSHLCAPNYCLRYRPAARQGETVDTSTGHIGFRCIVRPL